MAFVSLKKQKAQKQYSSSIIESAQKALNQTTDTIKRAILQNLISCFELSQKADATEAIIEALKGKIAKKSNANLKEQLERYKTELSELIEELNKIQLDVDKELDDVEKWKYSHLCEMFENLISCQKTWIIVLSKRNMELKSSASTVVERKEINFDTGVFTIVR